MRGSVFHQYESEPVKMLREGLNEWMATASRLTDEVHLRDLEIAKLRERVNVLERELSRSE